MAPGEEHLPDILLATYRHAEATIGLLQAAQPFPEGAPVDNVVALVAADEGEGEHHGVGGGQVGRLARAAAKAACLGVLHGPRRLHEAGPVGGHVLAQERQRVEAPVQDPRPAGVGAHVGARELAQVAAQEAGVALAVQAREPAGVALLEVGGTVVRPGARQERQDLIHRLVLWFGRFGAEIVLDGRGLRK